MVSASTIIFNFFALSTAVACGFIVPTSESCSNPSTSAISRTKLAAVALPPLPYDYTALEPHISKKTLEFHHDKHHAKYVATCNEMTQGTDLENASVEEIIMAAKGTNQGLFNNAAQSYNHAFYWQCLKAGGGGAPTGKVADMINESFGSYDAFRKEMVTAAATAFGSGWAWLVQEKGSNKLSVHKTIGADTPLADGHTPLLTIDVWEHAYYLDYQNLRPTYIDTVMDNLVNWDFVNSNIRA